MLTKTNSATAQPVSVAEFFSCILFSFSFIRQSTIRYQKITGRINLAVRMSSTSIYRRRDDCHIEAAIRRRSPAPAGAPAAHTTEKSRSGSPLPLSLLSLLRGESSTRLDLHEPHPLGPQHRGDVVAEEVQSQHDLARSGCIAQSARPTTDSSFSCAMESSANMQQGHYE